MRQKAQRSMLTTSKKRGWSSDARKTYWKVGHIVQSPSNGNSLTNSASLSNVMDVCRSQCLHSFPNHSVFFPLLCFKYRRMPYFLQGQSLTVVVSDDEDDRGLSYIGLPSHQSRFPHVVLNRCPPIFGIQARMFLKAKSSSVQTWQCPKL